MNDFLFRAVPRFLLTIVVLGGPAAAGIEDTVAICGACHDKADDPTVPNLRGQNQAYLEKQLREYRTGVRDNQIMASMAASLHPTDIPRVAAYFAGQPWPLTAARPQTTAMPAIVTTCQPCHQTRFTGGPTTDGPVPRLAGQTEAYLRVTMGSFASGERDNSDTMSTLMKTIPVETRSALAVYLSALNPEAERQDSH